MSDINSLCISGRLTKDAQLRQTAGGTPLLAFGVASNKTIRKNGVQEDKPCYLDCVIFGARAEGLDGRLSKGTKVFLQGELTWRAWEDGDIKRSKNELVVHEIVWYTSNSAAPDDAVRDLSDEDIDF